MRGPWGSGMRGPGMPSPVRARPGAAPGESRPLPHKAPAPGAAARWLRAPAPTVRPLRDRAGTGAGGPGAGGARRCPGGAAGARGCRPVPCPAGGARPGEPTPVPGAEPRFCPQAPPGPVPSSCCRCSAGPWPPAAQVSGAAGVGGRDRPLPLCPPPRRPGSSRVPAPPWDPALRPALGTGSGGSSCPSPRSAPPAAMALQPPRITTLRMPAEHPRLGK